MKFNMKFNDDFSNNNLIVKFNKLNDGEITEDMLNLSKREIECILIALKLTHIYDSLLNEVLGLKEI